MRIRTFGKYLDVEEFQDHILKDCTVIIDGQNIFSNLYEKSSLPSMYGCEADKYANCLRIFFKMFKKANVTCYCMFKGGSYDMDFKLKRTTERNIGRSENYFVQPAIMKDVVNQVLDEMSIEYGICEYGSKSEIIAFAQKYKCFIISYDIEFSFSGVPYVPYTTIAESSSEGIKCGLFDLRKFLEKYNLTGQKLSIFIVLTNERMFEEGYFLPLFESLNMSRSVYKRNISLLKWLGQLPEQRALNIIYKYVKKADFDEKLQDANKFIHRNELTGIPTKYIENKKEIEFTELDPDWFAKGVTIGTIATNYVNLYHNNVYFGSWTIEDKNAADSLLFSLDIIIYTFNLLTNFTKEEFTFHDKFNSKRTVSSTRASYGIVQKPNYSAVVSPFENGWDQVKNLRLFEHFLEECLQGFNHAPLQQAPEDVRLLIVTLVYFSRQKTIDTSNIVCSVLLSYVMLGVVFEKLPEAEAGEVDIKKKPYLDSTLEKKSVNVEDCAVANNILQKYFCMTTSESHHIFKQKLLHPFVEFQHCLVQLNNLNKLCGSSYKPTEYSKTFNGTFAYKFLFDAESKSNSDFVRKLLNPAPTVLSFFNGLFELYEEVLYR